MGHLTPIADITISHSVLPPPAAEIMSFDPSHSSQAQDAMKQEILMIAEALGYRKLERLRHLNGNVGDQLFLDILKASIIEPYAILFFPGKCFQVTPFGASFASAWSKARRSDNYLIAFPDLDEKFLRQAFTGFELVVYKVCHIVLENQNAEYQWETETTRQRIRRLQSLVSVTDWDSFFRLFDNIFFVRDAFAHSFIELKDIKYHGVPLDVCFGESFLGARRRDAQAFDARIFTDDLTALFDPIMKVFCAHQLKQIDATKFHKLCDRLLMSRSLAPRTVIAVLRRRTIELPLNARSVGAGSPRVRMHGR